MIFTANFTKIDSGYMGQIVEWPEIVTEGDSIDDCRNMLKDALNEMMITYRQLGYSIPLKKVYSEKIDLEYVS